MVIQERDLKIRNAISYDYSVARYAGIPYNAHLSTEDEHREIMKKIYQGIIGKGQAYTPYHEINLSAVGGYQTSIEHFNNIAKAHVNITCDKKIVSGMPTIKGTRIQVSLVLSCLADEMTFDEICEDYKIKTEDIKAALIYASDVLDRPFFDGK